MTTQPQQQQAENNCVVTVISDDYGMNVYRTDGILECFRAGSLSAASLMVNGDDAVRSVRLAKSAGLPLGLHFNLTQGRAVTPPTPHQRPAGFKFLADKENNFLDKQKFYESIGNAGYSRAVNEQLRAATVGGSDRGRGRSSARNQPEEEEEENDDDEEKHEEIELQLVNAVLCELAAQLARFEQLTGHFPTHLDGHHHIHALPVVAQAVLLFYRCPLHSDLTGSQRRLVHTSLPGDAAAAAVRALRHLRVPLPPLGDPSRAEAWRSNHASDDYPTWREGTVTGPAFFPRLVECAYSAMNLWERAGLFGPVGVDETSVVALDDETLATVAASSSSFSAVAAAHHHSPARASSCGSVSPSRNGATSNIVDSVSPLRRRGTVVFTSSAEVDEKNDQQDQEPHLVISMPAGTAHAIVPRRLVSFVSGPRITAEQVASSLRRFRAEEAAAAATTTHTAAGGAESSSVISLFENPKQIGSHFTCEAAARQQLLVPRWVSAHCEAEMMTHPGVQLPLLPSVVAAEKARELAKQKQDDGQTSSMSTVPLFLHQQRPPDDAEVFSFYGPTRCFYCTWSQSKERVDEKEFLTSDGFLQAVASSGYGIKAFAPKLMASGKF